MNNNVTNEYLPISSEVLEVIKHTDIEYTFRMKYKGEKVLPGQFFEISIPGYGEAPISASGIGDDYVDFTIRKVGKVTNQVFERYEGDYLFMRGPYGNGFDVRNYYGKELVIIAGGTGVSPVRGVICHFAENPSLAKSTTLIAGFKSEGDILFRNDFDKWRETIDVTLTLDTGEESEFRKVGFVTAHIPNLKFNDIKNAAAIVVGPPSMMKFSVSGLLSLGLTDEQIWISQERKMCCGLGKCGHCRIGDKYVCLDGPVFNYKDGKNLLD